MSLLRLECFEMSNAEYYIDRLYEAGLVIVIEHNAADKPHIHIYLYLASAMNMVKDHASCH